jgi:hypothetical protein
MRVSWSLSEGEWLQGSMTGLHDATHRSLLQPFGMRKARKSSAAARSNYHKAMREKMWLYCGSVTMLCVSTALSD